MGDMFSWLVDHWMEILAVLAALQLAAAGLARLTPNKTDDEFVAKLETWLDRLSSLFIRPTEKK